VLEGELKLGDDVVGTTDDGRSGPVVVGGTEDEDEAGRGGGGRLFEIVESTDGKTTPSERVDSDVPAVVGLEPTEPPQVRPEKLLEFDSRGSADFDCKSNRKSSIT
jgi:hypothetical protein